jgi:hypothetical protein
MSKQALSVRLLSLKLHETSQEIEKFFFYLFFTKKKKQKGSWGSIRDHGIMRKS